MRLVLATSAALLSLLAAGCGGSSSPAPRPAAVPPKLCPLTGQKSAADQDPDRTPLAVKIDNIDVARPQVGIDRADVVFEETVEGGLTRLFVVFQCNGADSLGPVRSARTSDAALLRLFDQPVFAFSGANPKALGPVQATSQALLLSYDANPTLFHRVPDRPIPHNVFTSTATLLDAATSKGHHSQPQQPLFGYAAQSPSAARTVSSLKLRWSPDANAAWSWSGGRWLRSQNGTPDVLADKTRVSATNVIVMRIKTRDTGIRDAVGHVSPDDVVTGSGTVWVFRNGKVVTGTWKRPGIGSPMALVDDGGAPIKLAPGVTWVELLPPPGTVVLGR